MFHCDAFAPNCEDVPVLAWVLLLLIAASSVGARRRPERREAVRLGTRVEAAIALRATAIVLFQPFADLLVETAIIRAEATRIAALAIILISVACAWPPAVGDRKSAMSTARSQETVLLAIFAAELLLAASAPQSVASIGMAGLAAVIYAASAAAPLPRSAAEASIPTIGKPRLIRALLRPAILLISGLALIDGLAGLL